MVRGFNLPFSLLARERREKGGREGFADMSAKEIHGKSPIGTESLP